MKLALALVLALGSTAAADSTEKARGHFKQGKAFQDAGAFERAANEYKLAYEADPRPEMLFNIAQAYRLAKQKQQALDYFKQYLDKQPNGPGSDEARRHVVTLTKELDEEKAAQQAPPPTMLPPPATTLADAPRERDEVESNPGRTLRITGVSIAAAGAIAFGVGVKFAFDARSASTAISDHEGPWTGDDEQRFADGERANRNMKIMYAVGGVLVAGGAVIYYLGARAKASPVVTTQSASLVVSGEF